MKVQVVGLPLATHRRLKTEVGDWATALGPNHSFRSSPSQNWPSIENSELNDIRANVQEGFVHIIVMPLREPRWRLIRDSFRFDCRVIRAWFTQDFKNLDWMFLEDLVLNSIEFEKRWLSAICPADLRHALLLPPPSFEPEKEVGDYWTSCDVYGDVKLIDRATQVLTTVIQRHRRGGGVTGHSWVDCRGRQFRSDPSRHGMTKEEREGQRRFRFCFEVPRGFHYDVAHISGNEFWVTDLSGKPHQVQRTNIDPWGQIR